jgi:hypothetical protein
MLNLTLYTVFIGVVTIISQYIKHGILAVLNWTVNLLYDTYELVKYYILINYVMVSLITLGHILFVIVLIYMALDIIAKLLPILAPIVMLVKIYSLIVIVVSSYITFVAFISLKALRVNNPYVCVIICVATFVGSMVRVPVIGINVICNLVLNLIHR